MKEFKLYVLPYFYFSLVIVLHRFYVHVFTSYVFAHRQDVGKVTAFDVVQNAQEITFLIHRSVTNLHEYNFHYLLYEQRRESVKQIHFFHIFFKMVNQVIR